MPTPAEVIEEQLSRSVVLADEFIAQLQEVIETLQADMVSQPVVDVEFAAVEEPTLQDVTDLRNMLEARLAGGTGLDATVEADLWNRAREREAATAQAQVDEITLQDEALGFDFPTGVMAARLDAAGQEYHNKVSSINRDISIEQARLEQANLKDAVQGLVQLFQFLMQQDVEHWRALISQNESTKQFVIAAAKINADILNDNRIARLDAAKVQAQVLAQLVAAAIGRVNLGASVSGSSSTSVGHSLGGSFSAAQMATVNPLQSI